MEVERGGAGVPPQNPDAERAVLGAMLLDSACIPDVSEILKPEDFFIPSHQIVFEAILGLYEATQPVDFITISERLQREGNLEKVGGRDYIVLLAESMTGAGRAVFHANMIRDTARLRGLMFECMELSDEARHFSGASIEEFLDEAESRIFEIAKSREGRDATPIAAIVEQEIHRILNEAGSDARSGLKSGFRELDEMTVGFQPGDLIILAARPSMGKTALALNFVEGIACSRQGGVAFFSLEMSVQQVGRRLLCSRARVDAQKVRTGERLTQAERSQLMAAAGELHESPIFVDDTPGISVLSLRSKARRLAAQHGIKMVVVDYLQLMDAPRAESRQQEIAIISRALKALGRELEVPVVALSQLNRSVDARDDKRPRMSDLRESGAIEQDADVVMMLFREEYYKQTENNQGLAELIIAKQRNGPTGTVKLHWSSTYTRFENLALPRDGMGL